MATVLAESTAKTTNLEKTIYFLSLMSFSINRLKPCILFFCKIFMFSDFTWKKISAPGNSPAPPRPPFLYDPAIEIWKYIYAFKSLKKLKKKHSKNCVNCNSHGSKTYLFPTFFLPIIETLLPVLHSPSGVLYKIVYDNPQENNCTGVSKT